MLHLLWIHAIKLAARFRQRSWAIICCGLLLGIIGPSVFAYSQTGATLATATNAEYLKSNQSKVFYHDGKWWALAFNDPDNRWYIWKFNGGSWTKVTELNKSSTLKYDAVINPATDKLYLMGSHASASEFWRFTYSSSTEAWARDSGFKVNPAFLNSDAANPVSLIQAKNGDLWIFRIASNKLEAKRSTNGGATWSAVITVKTGLTTATGTTDAAVFTAGGDDYVGVAYGEANAAGSKYGFLLHRDGDAETTWTDESTALTFFGSESATNNIAAATDNNNNVYLFTQNANVSGGAPNNTLYKRSSSGGWNKFIVNDNAAGLNWKTPALAVDTDNNGLYLLGVNNSTASAEYKACTFGMEASLNSAPPTVVLANAGAAFSDLSLPAQFVGTASGLMICGDNTTANDMWYNQLALGPISGGQPPITINSVDVSPNEANAAGSYTLALTLGEQGELTVGNGTITIQFPAGTVVPNSIGANQITVNGTPVITATSNSNTREVLVTTPVDLANSATVTLVFAAGANILNPATAGDYSVQAATSVQTTPASSPNYTINAATTAVTAATVTPVPTATNAAAAYTIAFNLGAHGRLLAGSSTMTMTFDNATGVTNGSLSGVQVNGVNATATGNSSNKTVTITVPASLSLDNGAAVTIHLPAAAITNPASPGNYTLAAATSVENTGVTSNFYTIELIGPVTVGGISLSTHEANAVSSYTVPITLGNNGALTAGTGTITIQFPDNTFVPNSVAASQILVNGTAASVVTSNSSASSVTITTPVNLANNASATVVFNAGASLLNPTIAGNYILQASTSAQPATASSPAYTIAAATTSVAAANVTLNPNTPSSAAAYAIAFDLGAHGRLVAGSSTLHLMFNSLTGVSHGNLSGVQVNSVNAAAIGNSSDKTITVTVPAALNLSNNAAVTISLPASVLTNPSSTGSYTLTVNTSVEITPIASNVYSILSTPPPPPTGVDGPIAGTTGGYDKPHQNRPFYHAGVWWTAARKASDGKWYLWKLNGSTWTAPLMIDSRKSTRPDCHVDSQANKLYVLLASTSSSGTKLLRLSYSGSAWIIDSGFPVVLSNFTFSGESGNVFVKAKNGELWAFRNKSSKLEGMRSNDGGLTWSSIITIKSGLVSSGLLDAVTFTSNGQNYVGVGYADNTSTSGKFGFLRHKDGDPGGSWTDETSVMPQFANAQSDDHMAMAVSANNEIFFVCKTHPNSSSAAGVGLLKRGQNGVWQNFTVQQGGGWTRPAVVVDETNNELFVFGTEEGSPDHGQYKKCAIGNENALMNEAVTEIFTGGPFNDISVPAHGVTSATGLLICAENTSKEEIWYNVLALSGGNAAAKMLAANDPADAASAQQALLQAAAYPNPFNPSTTIRFTLPQTTPVSLQIFNIRGELVKTLLDRDLAAGTHEQLWNGRDNLGRVVASGMYFYRLRLGADVLQGRLQMLK